MTLKLPYLSLLLCACWWQPNSAHRYRVIFADGIETANLQGITLSVQEAAHDWQYATGDFITFTFDPFDAESDGTITVHGIDTVDLRQKPSTSSDSVGITYWHLQSSDVWVTDDWGNADQKRRTVTHEMGHAIGLQHTGSDTIMYYEINAGSPIIACGDVQQVCQKWAGDGKVCDAASMPACQANNELQSEE